MLLPYRSKNPPESLPIATVALIAINVIVFFLTTDANHWGIDREVVKEYAVSASHFTLLRSFTSMFLHMDPFHLIGNMWFLYLFGFAVEGRLKTLKFLVVYFAAGFAGDGLQLLIGGGNPDIPSFGASGAIMGVVGAALYMFPYAQVDFFYAWGYWWWGTTTWAMYWVAAYFVGGDLLFGLLFMGADGVGHFAHLGGALGGLAACALFFPKRDGALVSNAKADLAEVKDYGALSSKELMYLASATPEDTTLVLNWLDRCLRDGQLSMECRYSLHKLFPRIVECEPPLAVGSAMLGMLALGEDLHPDWLLNVGTKLESSGEPTMALRLYDAVLAMPNAPAEDREQAMFRSAMVLECRLNDPTSAMQRYSQLISDSPMSPLADQARIRMRQIDPLSPLP